MVSKIKYLAIASVIALTTASGAFALERGGLSPAYISPDGDVFLQDGGVPMVDSRYMPEGDVVIDQNIDLGQLYGNYLGLGELVKFDEVIEIPLVSSLIPELKIIPFSFSNQYIRVSPIPSISRWVVDFQCVRCGAPR